MEHRVIYGGGAALAQPLLAKWLEDGHEVTAVVRTKDGARKVIYRHERLRIVTGNEYLEELATPGRKSVDVLATLTGSTADGTLWKMGREKWDRVIEDTLTSVYVALRATYPWMYNGGNVVVVGSVVGSLGGFGCANYAAAKAGLVGLVRSAAREWAAKDVRVNLLELGYIDSGMGARLDPDLRNATIDLIPLKRFGTEADFIQAVDFMAQTRYMTGNVLTLAGGMR